MGTAAATTLGHICMRTQNAALIRQDHNQASALRVKIQREAALGTAKALAQTERQCIFQAGKKRKSRKMINGTKSKVSRVHKLLLL